MRKQDSKSPKRAQPGWPTSLSDHGISGQRISDSSTGPNSSSKSFGAATFTSSQPETSNSDRNSRTSGGEAANTLLQDIPPHHHQLEIDLQNIRHQSMQPLHNPLQQQHPHALTSILLWQQFASQAKHEHEGDHFDQIRETGEQEREHLSINLDTDGGNHDDVDDEHLLFALSSGQTPSSAKEQQQTHHHPHHQRLPSPRVSFFSNEGSDDHGLLFGTSTVGSRSFGTSRRRATSPHAFQQQPDSQAHDESELEFDRVEGVSATNTLHHSYLDGSNRTNRGRRSSSPPLHGKQYSETESNAHWESQTHNITSTGRPDTGGEFQVECPPVVTSSSNSKDQRLSQSATSREGQRQERPSLHQQSRPGPGSVLFSVSESQQIGGQHPEGSSSELFSTSSQQATADTTTGAKKRQDISVKDAYWFLDSLEQYHVSKLNVYERQSLISSHLRDKPKHRNAVLFCDDYTFLFESEAVNKMKTQLEKLDRQDAQNPDSRVFLLHEACKIVLASYRLSLAHAPAKSCIWSAMMIRTAELLKMCGVSNVGIVDHVEGVQHKEATLVVQEYHISRSNFTKLCRALLRKEGTAASSSSSSSVPQSMEL